MSQPSPNDDGEIEMQALELAQPAPEVVTFDDVESLAPLTSYISTWPFWLKCFRWPFLFVVVNGLVVITLLAVVASWDAIEDEDEEETVNHMPKHRETIVLYSIGGLAFVDALISLMGAIQVKKDLDALGSVQEENWMSSDGSFWEPAHVHAKASILLDRFISQGQATVPRVSFLVNLFYALSGLLLSASITSWILGAYSKSNLAETYCFYDVLEEEKVHTKESDPFDNVPSYLQDWAWSMRDSNYGSEGTDFLHLTNGMTFFHGQGNDGLQDHLYMTLPNTNGTVVSLPDVLFPTHLFKITRNKVNMNASSITDSGYDTTGSNSPEEDSKNHEEAIIGFCCEYFGNATFTDNVHQLFCVYDTEQYRLTWEPASAVKSKSQSFTHAASMIWYQTENTMWLRHELHYYEEPMQIVISALDFSSDDLQIEILDSKAVEERDFIIITAPSCSVELMYMGSILAVALSGAISYLLLRTQDISSSLVPLFTTVVSAAMANYSEFPLLVIIILAVAGLVTIRLMMGPKLSDRNYEIVIWTLYCCLIPLPISFLIFLPSDFEVSLWVWMVFMAWVGLLLNHPVMQVMGGIGAVVVVVLSLTALIAGDMDGLFVIVPVVGVVSMGLSSLGYYSTKYRPYAVLYLKLLWRCLLRRFHHCSTSITEALRSSS